jgi:hypothetical protein
MRPRSLVISATLISGLVLALAVIASAVDPFVGTWKMNAAKSKSGPKSLTMTIEAQGNVYKTVEDIVDADGKTIHCSWTNAYDGKNYPVTGNSRIDTVSATKPNPNTVTYVFKKNGKKIESGQAVISKDGKTYTSIGSAKDANGQALNYTVFMEKQ